MSKITTLFLFFALLYWQQTTAQIFTQLGSDLDAEAANDGFGVETKFSADGQRLIVGGPGNEGGTVTTSNAGHARVFEWDGNNWVQLGNDIDGVNTSLFGFDVDISADGNKVIVGAYNSDIARVFEWDGTDWVQLGNDFSSNSNNRDHLFGFSVAMAQNGNRVIIGAPHGNNNGSLSGYTQVFDWDGTTWTQVGTNFNGNAGDKLGTGVAMSQDGNYLIIGAQDGRAGFVRSGYANVYKEDNGTWNQIGTSIVSNANINETFGHEVDIADHGHIVAVADNRYGSNRIGAIQAFCWDGNSWQTKGAIKTGTNTLEALGSSLGLSPDGNILMGGGVESQNARGKTYVFTWNGGSWDARPIILGEAGGDRSGRSSDVIAVDGTAYLAIGANYNRGNGIQAGHARVFTGCAPVYIVDSINTCNTSYTWSNGTTYTASTEICNAPYYVQGTNITGCDTIRQLILNIDPTYLPNAVVTQAGNTLSVAMATGATYQWVDCNNNNAPITGATAASFTPGQSGQYAVMIDENGCMATSPCYTFTMNSIGTLADGQNSIKVYPNPTSQSFTIGLGTAQEQVQVRLLDLSGRVLQEQFYEQLVQTEWSINSTAPAGMYILSVQVGKEPPVHLKLIKK